MGHRVGASGEGLPACVGALGSPPLVALGPIDPALQAVPLPVTHRVGTSGERLPSGVGALGGAVGGGGNVDDDVLTKVGPGMKTCVSWSFATCKLPGDKAA